MTGLLYRQLLDRDPLDWLSGYPSLRNWAAIPRAPGLVADYMPRLKYLLGNPELRRTFAIWVRAVVLRQSRHTVVLPKVRDLKELKMTLAERFDLWARQHEWKALGGLPRPSIFSNTA